MSQKKTVKLSEEGRKALDELITQTALKSTIPGFTFGVTSTQGAVYSRAGGHVTQLVGGPNEQQTTVTTTQAVTTDSMFWISSQTKLVTNYAALKLIADGLLSPTDPVSKFLPQLSSTVLVDDTRYGVVSTYTAVSLGPNTEKGGSQILIKHLLNHTSGLYYPLHPVDMPYMYTERLGDEDDFWEALKGAYPGVPVKFEAGSDFVYGWSSDVLGLVVQKVWGKDLDECFKDLIFTPLNMASTTFRITPPLEASMLPFMWRNEDGGLVPWSGQLRVMESEPEKVKVPLGGAGLYTTTHDYLAFVRHILQIRDNPRSPSEKSIADALFDSTDFPEAAHKSLSDILGFVFPAGLSSAEGALDGVSFTFGSVAKTGADWEGGRREGSLFWLGGGGKHFWIDPTTGIGGTFATQLFPAFDREVLEVFGELERVFYRNLVLE